MADALEGAWSKLDRAREHLEDLRRWETRVRDDPAYRHRVLVDYDAKLGCHVSYLKINRGVRIPIEAGLVLGDLIHNARGALEFITWQLALKKLNREPTKRETQGIQFPICDGPNDFASKALLKYISEEAAREIERQQPYKPHYEGELDDHPLVRLRTLSNRDKHQLLINAVPGQPMYGHQFVADPPATFLWALPIEGEDQLGERGGRTVLEMHRIFVFPPDQAAATQVDVDQQPTLDIRFVGSSKDIGLLEIEEILKRVERIIGRFNRLL